ncbi:MAG: PHB depolymerase family esterase [Burkholderiaceae bacterium]
MLKSLTRLWLSGVKQAAKAQRSQQRKLLKSLLPKPPAKARPSPAKARPSPAKAAVTSLTPAKVPRRAAVPPAAGTRVPGKWMAFAYSSLADGGKLPVRRMPYWLYIPASAPVGPLPLVMMLHGCEQSAEQFARGTRMNALAEQKGFAVAYPQQSLRGHPNRCWHWYERTTQDGGDDVHLIAGIIDKVCGAYPIDRARIYVAGLSAGAGMANILALRHPDKIAAVGLHSGPIFGAGHSKTGAYSVMQLGASHQAEQAIKTLLEGAAGFPAMPAILIQGREDRIVRRINQEQLEVQFRLINRLDANSAEPPVDKPGRASGRRQSHAYRIRDYRRGRKVLLRVCDVAQLEHAWSGGDCTLKYNACAGPDASRMMWDFFSRHRR